MKIGIASRAGRVRSLPSALRWPERKVGKRGTTVPLTFVARHGASLGAAHLTGPGRRSWRVTANRCKGHLAAGDRCLVFVRFKPRKRGTLHASLSLAGGGTSARVSLIGHGRGS